MRSLGKEGSTPAYPIDGRASIVQQPAKQEKGLKGLYQRLYVEQKQAIEEIAEFELLYNANNITSIRRARESMYMLRVKEEEMIAHLNVGLRVISAYEKLSLTAKKKLPEHFGIFNIRKLSDKEQDTFDLLKAMIEGVVEV